MALSIGIIGLPNVGKSTLFNALTGDGAEVSNYPFCTVAPNVGTVEVPDPRLERLSEVIQPQSTTPTNIRFVDIAGLVRGANEGAGLGNQFLAHIRDVDALVHVVRCFDDAQISHVDGAIDPLRDIEIIETELLLADLAVMEKAVPHLDKVVRSEPRSTRAPRAGGLRQGLSGIAARNGCVDDGVDPRRKGRLAAYSLLTAKPVLYAANVGEVEVGGAGAVGGSAGRTLWSGPSAGHLGSARSRDRWSEPRGTSGVQSRVGTGTRGDRALSPGRIQVAGSAYLLHARPTASYRLGSCRVGKRFHVQLDGSTRTWRRGLFAPRLASCEQLITMEGWAPLKAAGQLRSEGRDYVVADGDVITFLLSLSPRRITLGNAFCVLTEGVRSPIFCRLNKSETGQ